MCVSLNLLRIAYGPVRAMRPRRAANFRGSHIFILLNLSFSERLQEINNFHKNFEFIVGICQ